MWHEDSFYSTIRCDSSRHDSIGSELHQLKLGFGSWFNARKDIRNLLSVSVCEKFLMDVRVHRHPQTKSSIYKL